MFSDIITGISPTVDVMPVFHSCDIFALRSILETKKLATQKCDVFTKEELLYCFYGKPSYRLNLKESTNNLAYFPACFILNTKDLPSPYKIYPFDTGAFVKLPNIKDDYFHHKMEVTHFLVGDEIDSARALIEKIYSSNANYFDDKPTINVEHIPPTNLEALCYLNLIKSKRQSKFDDRVTSIEVMFNQSIDLTSNIVENIVLPRIFLDDAVVHDVVTNELKITDPIAYETHRGSPIEYQALFMSEVRKVLKM